MLSDIFYNELIERQAIGCFLLNGSRHSLRLSAEDFCNPLTRFAFQLVQHMERNHAKIDLITLTETARKSKSWKTYENEFQTFLMGCVGDTPSVALADSIVNHLKDMTQRRNVKAIAEKMLNDLSYGDTGAVIDEARNALKGVGKTADGTWYDTEKIMTITADYLDKKSSGKIQQIFTGLKSMDLITGGLTQGEMTVLAGRTGGGKSAFSQFVALNAAKAGKRVLFVSREMSPLQYGIRTLASQTGVESSSIRNAVLTDREYERIGDGFNNISTLPIRFAFNIASAEDLRYELQQIYDTEGGIDLVVIDYLQIMATKEKTANEYARVSKISRICKEYTLQFNCALLLLSQVSRGVGILSNNDLRDSGCIEQDADNVWLINTPKRGDDDWVDDDKVGVYNTLAQADKRLVMLDVAKSRMGKLASTWVCFDPAHMNYTDLLERSERL